MIFINENIFNKNSKKIAYFRSNVKSNVGDVISLTHYQRNKEWTERKELLEESFELYRKTYFPHKPSRLTSVFSSPYNKKTRFFQKYAFTYKVQLIGNVHYGDSYYADLLIDNLSSRYSYTDQELIEIGEPFTKPYWKGKLNKKENIEILSEKVKILEILQDTIITKGDIISFSHNVVAKAIKFKDNPPDFFLKNYTPQLDDLNHYQFKVTIPKNEKFYVNYIPKTKKGKIINVTGFLLNDPDQTELSVGSYNPDPYQVSVYNLKEPIENYIIKH